MRQSSGKLGCWGAFGVLLIIALVVQYWYVVVALAIIAGAVYWYLQRQKAEAAAEQAEKQQAQEKEADTIAKIKAYKQLLDDGAITQDEYDRKKKDLLGDEWDKF